MKKRQLGKTELFVTPIGLGVLTIGRNQLHLPLQEGADIISYAIHKGINFFDTAQYYQTYPYLQRALQELSPSQKEDLVICSKSLTSSYKGMQEAITEALQSLQRDYIDIFLLHEVTGSSDYKRRFGAWQCLLDYKKKGVIRAIGLSTHHVDVTAFTANIPECDVVFPLINYAGLGIRKGNGVGSAAEMADAIRLCADTGKGVFGMKAFGGGNLTGNYMHALTYATSLYGITSTMVGMGKFKEIDDLVAFVNGTLPFDYQPDIRHKKIRIDAGDCIGCGACLKRCPNQALHWGASGLVEVDHKNCLTCGYCAPVCPTRALLLW